jgi:hypothetical protein
VWEERYDRLAEHLADLRAVPAQDKTDQDNRGGSS